MSKAEPVPAQGSRIFFLRPKDRDDGSNGGGASIEVNREPAGALRYGGFLYVDVAAGATSLTAFGRYKAFGVCEIDVAVAEGSKIFVDVSPRTSYMIGGVIGGALGGIAGAAVTPDVYGSAGAAIATGVAGTAAGSAAGSAAANSAEGKGKACGGPYRMEIIAEDIAVQRLQELTWSKAGGP